MPRTPASVFATLFCVLFSVIFNYTISIMASPYIVADLGGSNDIATYTVSFFALGNAIGIPLGRALMGRIGPVPFLIAAMLLFAFFSLTCALSTTYAFFNASRFMQGFVSGPFYALAFHLLGCLAPNEKKNSFTAIALTLFTIGPVLGACWGGWIAYDWNWRWIFYLNIPLKLILAGLLWLQIRHVKIPTPNNRFDGIGYLFYTYAIFTLGFAIITGQELDWGRSNLILFCFGSGIPALLFFIVWEIYHPYPILALRLLKHRTLSFALIYLAILFSAYFGTIILLSLWLKLWVNYTPTWIAALLGTMAITGLFPVFLIHKRIARIDNRIFLGLAILFLALSCLHTMTFNVDINMGRIVSSRLLAGLGLALFLPPIFHLSFQNISEEDRLKVMGLFQVVRALGSGLGVAIYAVMWQRRQVFFHDRLGSELTANSPNTQEFFRKAEEIGLHGERADAQLEYYLQREASSLALDDCFYLMAWILIALFFFLAASYFIRRRSRARQAH
jgi:DHA2 family multidrug resistance protein